MHACAVQCDARLPSGDRSVVGRGDHGCDLCTASEQPGICHGARLGEPVARVQLDVEPVGDLLNCLHWTNTWNTARCQCTAVHRQSNPVGFAKK